MVDITKYPEAVSLTGNDIVFKAYGSYGSASVGYAVIALEYVYLGGDTNPSLGFKLKWGVFEETFLISLTGPWDVVGNVNDQLVNFIETVLKVNINLTTDFKISYAVNLGSGYYDIIFTARKSGPVYELTKSLVNPATNYDFTRVRKHAGTNLPDVQFYGLGIQIWKYDELGETELVGEDKLLVDYRGEAIFRIQEYLHGLLKGGFHFPEELDEWVKKVVGYVGKYMVRVYDSYWNDIANKWTNLSSKSSEDYWALKGMLGNYKLALMNEENTGWWAKHVEGMRFLNFYPEEKIVDERMPEKLYYIVSDSAVTGVKLKVKLYYQDGWSKIVTLTKDLTVAKYDVLELMVGMWMLKVDSIEPGRTLMYYQVWLADQEGGQISEVRSYRIDRKEYAHARYFLFKNSLGNFEVLRTTGEQEKNAEIERTMVQVVLPDGFKLTDKELKQVDAIGTEVYSLNSGWVSKAVIDYLQDFSQSPEVYQIINNRLYPITLISTKHFMWKDNEYLYSLDFEFVRGYAFDGYVGETIQEKIKGDYNNDYGSDYFNY